MIVLQNEIGANCYSGLMLTEKGPIHFKSEKHVSYTLLKPKKNLPGFDTSSFTEML